MTNLNGPLAVRKYAEDGVSVLRRSIDFNIQRLSLDEKAQTYRRAVELLEIEAAKLEAYAQPYTWDQFKDAVDALAPASRWSMDLSLKPKFVYGDCECDDPADCDCEPDRVEVPTWTKGAAYTVLCQRQEAVVPGSIWVTWEVRITIDDERKNIRALMTQRNEPRSSTSGAWSLKHNKATGKWENDNV